MTEININYKISTHDSKFLGWQSKAESRGIAEIKLFVSTIYKHNPNFNDFVMEFICILLIERICLEFAFNHVRMRPSRCKPFKKNNIEHSCLPAYVLYEIMEDVF